MPRFPDNMFDASIGIIRDIAADTFHTVDDTPIKPTSKGDNVKRYAELGRIDNTGARSISRDKEYKFRPKLAPLNPEQINYRHFADPPEETGGSALSGSTFLGDDPGEDPGTIFSGIGTNEEEEAGSDPWQADYDKVGFEISLISDIGGAMKTKPDWNPSHMNSENRSTLVISRRGKEDEDKGDDLPHRYFSRVSDIMVPVATNDVLLQRVRYKGGSEGIATENPLPDLIFGGDDPGESAGAIGVGISGGGSSDERYGDSFFKKDRELENYRDGIWKSSLNITPLESPGMDLDQKNEHNDGPGQHGWAAHDYVEGFPQVQSGGSDDADPPTQFPQGGWLYDAKQDTLGSLQDLIGIDGWVVPDCALPRYRNRHNQKVSIAYIRHDAHFMKRGDHASPPPKAGGVRLSGRIYFTKEFTCPEAGTPTPGGGGGGPGSVATGGGLGPVTGSPPNQPQPGPPQNQETGTPVCGEMVLDVKKADHADSKIKHESGEWRPMLKVTNAGGDKYDYSYHSKPKKYSGSGTMSGGGPTPSGRTTTGGGGPGGDAVGGGIYNPNDPPDAGQGGTLLDGSTFMSSEEATPSNGTMTTQSQMGSPPPESPGNSQNVNIFDNIQSPEPLNVAAVFTTTKPIGYRTLKLVTWIRVSDDIPDGESIEMNIIAGEYARDGRGPQEFFRAPIFLAPVAFPADHRWRQVTTRFTMFDDSDTHPITVWVERRNDLSDVAAQVWILKHNISFEP